MGGVRRIEVMEAVQAATKVEVGASSQEFCNFQS